jgi:ArsR family transcriptional regulator
MDDEVFDLAARTFRVMSAPMRLKIISALCDGEKSVSQLLDRVQTTQPNMSQHLASLFRAGVVGKRRDGVSIYYRITNDRVVSLCRTLCHHLSEPDADGLSRTGRRGR